MKLSKLFIFFAIFAILILLLLSLFHIMNYRNSIQKIQEANAQILINTITNNILKECEQYLFDDEKVTLQGSFARESSANQDLANISKIIENGLEQYKQTPSIVFILVENKDTIIAISNQTLLSNLQKEKYSSNTLLSQNQYNLKYKSFGNREILEISKPIEIPKIASLQVRLGYDTQIYASEYYRSLNYSIFSGILAILIALAVIVYAANRTKSSKLNNSETNMRNAMRELFDSLADGVIILDKNKYIKYINQSASEILEMDKFSSINDHYEHFFDYDYFNIENVLKDGSPSAEMNVKLHTKLGNIKYLSYTTGLVNFTFDKSSWVLIILRDISEQVKAQKQEELEERKLALEEIARSLSDRIKNPLNAIYLIINQIEDVQNQEISASSIKILRNEIKNINAIIDNFLEYAKPINLNLKKINLSELLDDIIAMYSKKFEFSKISFHKDYPIYLPIFIDPALIRQAIEVFAQKSIDSIENEGDIIFSLYNKIDEITIRITDNGKGLSEEEKNRLFNLGFSSNQTLDFSAFAKAEQIIILHNGTLTIDSCEHGGTTFEITLPNKTN